MDERKDFGPFEDPQKKVAAAGRLSSHSLHLLNKTMTNEREIVEEASRYAQAHELLDDGIISMSELRNAAKNFCMSAKESEAVKYMMDKFEIICEQSNDQLGNDDGITSNDLKEHSSRLAQGKGLRDTTWDFFTDAIRFVSR